MIALILAGKSIKSVGNNNNNDNKQAILPLISIADQPLINYIIEKIEELPSIDTIYIITNNRYYNDFVDWKEGILSSKNIEIINNLTNTPEETRGAVADIQYIIDDKKITNDLLVIASDNLFDISLVEMLAYFNEKKASVLGVIDLQLKEKLAKKYGIVEINKENQIINFEEKPEQPKTSLAAMCIYFLAAKDLFRIKNFLQEKQENIVKTNGDFIKYLASQTSVYVFPFTDGWMKISDEQDLEKARELYTHKRMII